MSLGRSSASIGVRGTTEPSPAVGRRRTTLTRSFPTPDRSPMGCHRAQRRDVSGSLSRDHVHYRSGSGSNVTQAPCCITRRRLSIRSQRCLESSRAPTPWLPEVSIAYEMSRHAETLLPNSRSVDTASRSNSSTQRRQPAGTRPEMGCRPEVRLRRRACTPRSESSVHPATFTARDRHFRAGGPAQDHRRCLIAAMLTE